MVYGGKTGIAGGEIEVLSRRLSRGVDKKSNYGDRISNTDFGIRWRCVVAWGCRRYQASNVLIVLVMFLNIYIYINVLGGCANVPGFRVLNYIFLCSVLNIGKTDRFSLISFFKPPPYPSNRGTLQQRCNINDLRRTLGRNIAKH